MATCTHRLDPDLRLQVDRLVPLVRRYARGPCGVALGGAHAKGVADGDSDLDLYVFADAIEPGDTRAALTWAWDAAVRDVVCWGGDEAFNEAGTDFYLGALKVECWLRNCASIERSLAEARQGLVRRHLVTWTTTGFYNHCCLADLAHMVVVHDPSGVLNVWQRGLGRYPEPLRRAIIGEHLDAARFWPAIFHYRSAIERLDVIYTTGIVQQVVHNLVQVLFAANRTYFAGDKKLAAALDRLPTVPVGFAARVNQLLYPGAPATLDRLRQQQAELQSMLAEVEAVVSATAAASPP